MAFARIPTPAAFRRWPVRWRLTLVSASLTFFILLVFGAVVGNLTAQRVRSDFNRDLEETATRLVGRTRVVENPLGGSGVTRPEIDDVALASDAAARVVNVNGEVVEQTGSKEIEFGPIHLGVSNHGSVGVVAAPLTDAERNVVAFIQYARSTDTVSTTITKLWLFIAVGVIAGTALAVLAGLALASRAMRPIASLTATAREVATTQDPSRRIPEATTDDEVGELTNTLQQMLTALDTARNDREAALQKQREFVADASHELRTPLTSILANLELLEAQLGSARDSEEREVVGSAVRSSRRMSRLVSDLLFLAKSDAGQHRAMSDCDLGEIAEGAAREVSSQLGGRMLDTQDCLPAPVHGNQDDLHRLVLNLLDNAIAYTAAGARIAVRTGVTDERAEVEVADSGPGIPAPMRERVFERFVRTSNGADTSTTSGTGLGLAMVKAIAVAHGGTASAGASDRLGGASIVISLPLQANPARVAQAGDRALS
jgi:two-component system OmpR family sensor kinase